MVTVLLRFRVSDYDFWRPRYEKAVARDLGQGLHEYRVWRSQDDPNQVVIMETWDKRETFETLMSDPALQAEIVADGVDTTTIQLDFLNEVTAEAR